MWEWMQDHAGAVWVAVGPLIGVVVGGGITAWTQTRQREEDRRDRDRDRLTEAALGVLDAGADSLRNVDVVRRALVAAATEPTQEEIWDGAAFTSLDMSWSRCVHAISRTRVMAPAELQESLSDAHHALNEMDAKALAAGHALGSPDFDEAMEAFDEGFDKTREALNDLMIAAMTHLQPRLEG